MEVDAPPVSILSLSVKVSFQELAAEPRLRVPSALGSNDVLIATDARLDSAVFAPLAPDSRSTVVPADVLTDR